MLYNKRLLKYIDLPKFVKVEVWNLTDWVRVPTWPRYRFQPKFRKLCVKV